MKKDTKSIKKAILGGSLLAGLSILTPYLAMYDVINTGITRQIYFLLIIIYILGVFSDYVKTIVFESSGKSAE